jgi:hypothetical protein
LINLLMADGGFDHAENHNELINPGEKYFKWRRTKEYAQEVGGKPWDNGTSPF